MSDGDLKLMRRIDERTWSSRRPNTSRAHPAHPVYPYLLRGLSIERSNQVWTLDITYVPMARGFVYLIRQDHRHGFSILRTNRETGARTCEIYLPNARRPKDVDGEATLILGHELLHCMLATITDE